jgi:hypothetical protein
MGPRQRSDEELVRALGTELDADILSEDYPLVEVEKELREAGGDPVEVSRWGTDLVHALAKKRRLSWQEQARKTRDAMQAKLAGRPTVGTMPRAELLSRIEAARRDSRLQAPVAIAARNLASGEASEEELRQILEDLEALALIARKGGDGDDQG